MISYGILPFLPLNFNIFAPFFLIFKKYKKSASKLMLYFRSFPHNIAKAKFEQRDGHGK